MELLPENPTKYIVHVNQLTPTLTRLIVLMILHPTSATCSFSWTRRISSASWHCKGTKTSNGYDHRWGRREVCYVKCGYTTTFSVKTRIQQVFDIEWYSILPWCHPGNHYLWGCGIHLSWVILTWRGIPMRNVTWSSQWLRAQAINGNSYGRAWCFSKKPLIDIPRIRRTKNGLKYSIACPILSLTQLAKLVILSRILDNLILWQDTCLLRLLQAYLARRWA